MNYNKELNSRCYCNIGLPWVNDIIVMCHPCEHMFHNTCYKKLNKICRICNTSIKKIYTLRDKNIHPQIYADLLSMSYYNNLCSNTLVNFSDSIFSLTNILIQAVCMKTKTDGKELCKQILSLNNLSIRVNGYDKIKPGEKVFIANHSSFLELFIIYYLLYKRFLASSFIKKTGVYDYIKDIVPLLLFDRNKKGANVVVEIKKFIKKNKSICIFPEGIMTHPKSLIRFRSGAFHIGKPIYSIAVKYNDIVCDDNIGQFFYKLCGKQNIKIDVTILGPYYPPFSTYDIEKIRYELADNAGIVLSRVTNRDVNDE